MQPQKKGTERKFFGELLVEAGIATPEQIQEAIQIQQKTQKKLGQILLEKAIINEKDLLSFLQQQYNVPFRPLRQNENLDESLFDIIPHSYCLHHSIVPIQLKGGVLTVAMADPSDLRIMDEIRFMADSQIEVVLATESSIQNYLKEQKDDARLESPELDSHPLLQQGQEEGEEDDAPVVKMLDRLINDAYQKGASDIHIETLPKELMVRYRLDGILYVIERPRKSVHAPLISRLKILANMDISEKRLPQDGRIKYTLKSKREIDMRISTVPSINGESAVMRLLDREGKTIGLGHSGLFVHEEEIIRRHIFRPNGMILMTGPTGSGKTTTLYGILQQVHTPEKKILTVEDPIEYQFDGITQVQAHAEIGLTFAAGLRTFLRQDPDVIMVGEIRDQETAEIAIRSALTGHLVLSTVHTNDAPSAVTRLVDMGIESYLVSSTVVLVVSQRLVRTLCSHCKQKKKMTSEFIKELAAESIFAPGDTYYEPEGCKECNQTGYVGRKGIFEILEMDEKIQHLLNVGKSGLEIKEYAIQSDMATLRQSGLLRVKNGDTSLEEVFRVTL